MVGRILGWRENVLPPKSKCGESSKEGSSSKTGASSKEGVPSTCVFFTWYSSSHPHKRHRSRGRRKEKHKLIEAPEASCTTEDTSSASMSSESSVPPAEQDNTEMVQRLKAQLEFYFSTENLSRDTYLRSLLSPCPFAETPAAPLAAIANFPKVRALAKGDTQLLQRALEASDHLALSPDKLWIIPLKPLPPLDLPPPNADLSSSSSSASLNSAGAPTAPITEPPKPVDAKPDTHAPPPNAHHMHPSHNPHAFHARHPYPHPQLHHSVPPVYHYPPHQTYHHAHYPRSHSMPPQPLHPHPYPPHMHHHFPQHATPLYHHHETHHAMHMQHAPHALHQSHHYAPYPLPHANVPPPNKNSRRAKKDRKKTANRNESPISKVNAADKKTSQEKFSKSSKDTSRMLTYSHPKMKKMTPQGKQSETPSSINAPHPTPLNKFKTNGKKGKKQSYHNTVSDTLHPTELKPKEEMKDTDLKCNVNFPALGGAIDGNDAKDNQKEKEDGNVKGYAQALLRSSLTSTSSNNRKDSRASSISSADGMDPAGKESPKSDNRLKDMDSEVDTETRNNDVNDVVEKMSEMNMINGHSSSNKHIHEEDNERSDNVTATSLEAAGGHDEDKSKAKEQQQSQASAEVANSSSANPATAQEHKDAPTFNTEPKEAATSNHDQATFEQEQRERVPTDAPSKQAEEVPPTIGILTEEEHPPLPTQKLETSKDKDVAAMPAGAWGKKPSFLNVVRNET